MNRSPYYSPFERGRFPTGVRTIEARDAARDRLFTCEIWYPGEPGTFPLIIFSHHSGGNRLDATFLTTHLASHGYLVAALDHSELFAPELAVSRAQTAAERAALIRMLSRSRVQDVGFLLDHLLDGRSPDPAIPDPDRIGIVGHSIGGWTALAVPETDTRVRAVVALAPGGASNPKPGIIPATLTFAWSRPVATLYLVAEQDVCLPLAGMYELFDRTPGSKQMVILRRADHLHFVDQVEQAHERMRATAFPPEASWINREMRPIADLCSGDEAHRFIRGLTAAHFDAAFKAEPEARRVLGEDLQRALAANSIDACERRYPSSRSPSSGSPE